MPIDFSQLDEHSESETLEFKETFDKQTLETIGAFANTAGGVILVGVRDDGLVIGVNVGKNTLEEWAQKMQSKLQPRLLPSVTKQRHNNRTVAVIKVERSRALIAVDGRYFKRVGRTNQVMGPEEYTHRLLAAGAWGWDATVEDRATIDDLDEKAIEALLSRLKAVGRRSIPKDENSFTSLEKLGLVENGKPTRAAILLLGKNPKRFYPSAYVKAGRFKSPTMIVDDKEFDGTILQQLDKTMEWFQDRLTTALVIGTSKLSSGHKLSGRSLAEREEVWEYPLSALREGISNAICHRNYTSLAASTVRLYDNRLEIWNPGTLPFQLSPADLLQQHESYPHNRLIAETFYNLGIIERWGTGTVRMAEALKEQHLPTPEFDVSFPETFKLIMRSEKLAVSEEELNDRQLKAMEYLRSAATITNAEYQELFNASKPTATRDLTDLVEKGLISKEGTRGKGTSYRLTRP